MESNAGDIFRMVIRVWGWTLSGGLMVADFATLSTRLVSGMKVTIALVRRWFEYRRILIMSDIALLVLLRPLSQRLYAVLVSI